MDNPTLCDLVKTMWVPSNMRPLNASVPSSFILSSAIGKRIRMKMEAVIIPLRIILPSFRILIKKITNRGKKRKSPSDLMIVDNPTMPNEM